MLQTRRNKAPTAAGTAALIPGKAGDEKYYRYNNRCYKYTFRINLNISYFITSKNYVQPFGQSCLLLPDCLKNLPFHLRILSRYFSLMIRSFSCIAS